MNIRSGPRKVKEDFVALNLVKKWWTQAGKKVEDVREHMDNLSTSFGDVSNKVKKHFKKKDNHKKLVPIVEETERRMTSAFEGVNKELDNLVDHGMEFLSNTHRILNKTRLEEEIKENCFFNKNALKYVLSVSDKCSDDKCQKCTGAVVHLDVEKTREILEKVANEEEEEKKSSKQEKKKDEVVKKDDTKMKTEKKDPADLTKKEVQSLTENEKGEIEAEAVQTKAVNGLVDVMFYVKRNRFVPGKDLNDGFRSVHISKAEMFHLQLKALVKDFQGGRTVTCGRMVSRYKDVLEFFLSEDKFPEAVEGTPYADKVESLLKGISTNRRNEMKKCNGFIEVSLGFEHTCGITSEGAIECFGLDNDGQSNGKKPKMPAKGRFTQVGVGNHHTCGLTSEGAIECFGSDIDDRSNKYQPKMPTKGTFTQVSAGVTQTCGLTSEGAIECFGRDRLGQSNGGEPKVSTKGGRFTQVSAGSWHTCGLTSEGAIECFGKDDKGQSNEHQPKMATKGTFTQVSAGFRHTCGVTSEGAIECFGKESEGQSNGGIPKMPSQGRFTQVSAGYFHTCGLTSEGAIECFGKESEGQSNGGAPKLPTKGRFTQVSAGGSHTCGLTSEGAIECFGSDNKGQSNEHKPKVPTKAAPSDTVISFLQVAEKVKSSGWGDVKGKCNGMSAPVLFKDMSSKCDTNGEWDFDCNSHKELCYCLLWVGENKEKVKFTRGGDSLKLFSNDGSTVKYEMSCSNRRRRLLQASDVGSC